MYFDSVMYRVISIEVSFHTCFKISFSSNIVDSQSFASEKGVILILSSLMSKSGLELVDVMLDELLASGGAPEPPVLVGVLADLVSQKRTTPLTNSRGGGSSLLNQTLVFRFFFSIAKTESVTFVTTGDNEFVMS